MCVQLNLVEDIPTDLQNMVHVPSTTMTFNFVDNAFNSESRTTRTKQQQSPSISHRLNNFSYVHKGTIMYSICTLKNTKTKKIHSR